MRSGLRAPALVVGALLSVLWGTCGSPLAHADPAADRNKQLQRQIEELKEALEGTNDELVAAAVQLEKAKAQLVEARAVQAAADAALEQARKRDALLASQLAQAEAEVDKISVEITAGKLAEKRTRSTLGRMAREAYSTAGMTGLSLVLDAGSPEAFADRMAVASAQIRQQNGVLDRLRIDQAGVAAQAAKLDAIQIRAAALRAQAAQEVKVRKAAQDSADAAASAVNQLVSQQAGAVAVIEREKAGEQARIDRLQAEQDKLLAEIRARQQRRPGGSDNFTDTGGTLSRPLDAPMSSPFGPRYHPILHYWRMHTGQDFAAPCGTPVHASAGGTIISAGWAGGYGNRVVIDHGQLVTTYNHLSSIRVYSGSVNRGQVIGKSGTTGLSTGCHLHFEVIRNGDFKDPRKFF